jgi:hypothetical protein
MVQDAESLTLGDRLARIRPIVEALSESDPDREDLIFIFDALEDALLSVHQLQGALNAAKWALEVALEKISKQKEALDVLSIGKD